MEVVDAALGEVQIGDIVRISSVAEAAGREAIEQDRAGWIHGDHLERIVENARPSLEVDQRVIHSVAAGLICDVTAEISGQMSDVSVNESFPRAMAAASLLSHGWSPAATAAEMTMEEIATRTRRAPRWKFNRTDMNENALVMLDRLLLEEIEAGI